jgi:hypothetical protein
VAQTNSVSGEFTVWLAGKLCATYNIPTKIVSFSLFLELCLNSLSPGSLQDACNPLFFQDPCFAPTWSSDAHWVDLGLL